MGTMKKHYSIKLAPEWLRQKLGEQDINIDNTSIVSASLASLDKLWQEKKHPDNFVDNFAQPFRLGSSDRQQVIITPDNEAYLRASMHHSKS